MCAGGVFCLIAIYYTYVEITEIIWIGPKAYAGNVYNYIDFFFLTSAYAVFAYNVWHIFQIRSIQKAFLANRFRYINMDDLLLGWKTYIQVLGVMNFMAWLKPMRFVSFHRSIQQVLSAVRVSFKSIVSLCLLCLIITGAFAQLGCIAFSQVHQEYTTEFASIIAQIRFLMTDISYTSLEDAHPDLAPFFFVVLVVATYCIILNLFKAIYLSAEEDVKRQLIVNDYKVIRMLLQGFKYYLCFWRKLSSEEIHTVEMRQEQDNLPDKDVNGKPKYIYQVEPLIKLREQLALESERCTRLEEILEVFVDTIENIEQLQKPKKVKKKHN
ncbi:polycystic kidney disease 2-like 2 protein [Drosophila hydei]|nr:polycystic kidney disease 2-like 2 protein [Drosophila hydei]